MATRAEPRTKSESYVRFDSIQRAQHLLLIISFTLLALTGLPQKFAGNSWAETLIGLLGGIENTRVLHHYAAIILILVSIAEFIQLGYKIFVVRARWTMFPRLQDVFDALNQFFYNLGWRNQAPKYDRYTFAEKFEYWALVWGTVVMALTGFMLWNPILTSGFLSGDIIPAAKAAHGGEAILAVLAILIWHTYNVHFKMFNRSMFTGKMSRHEMEEEHPLELELIEKGEDKFYVGPDKYRASRRTYLPIAFGVALVMLFGVYLFVTAETTAVSTIPPAEARREVFVPQTKTPTPTRVPTNTPAPPTSTVQPGQPTFTPASEQPSPVPAVGAIPLPADHAGRAVCQVCHATGVGGAPKNPPDHEGRLDATCTDCHKPK